MDPVLALTLLSAAFVGTHVVLSHPPVREPLVARFGQRGFRAGYSVLSIALWAPLVYLWFTNRHAGAAWWVLRSPAVVWICEATAATGLALVVAAVVQPAASSMEARYRGAPEVRGAAHVTRHPMMVGVALLAAAHLPTNGWTGDLVVWGSHAALALLGALHQDRRLAASQPGYAGYMARTTFWPNPAGLLRMGRRALLGGLAGVALAVALRAAHGRF